MSFTITNSSDFFLATKIYILIKKMTYIKLYTYIYNPFFPRIKHPRDKKKLYYSISLQKYLLNFMGSKYYSIQTLLLNLSLISA